jgi:hypothetical protein
MHFCTVEVRCRLPGGHAARSAVDSAVLMRVAHAASLAYCALISALNLSMHTEPEVVRVLRVFGVGLRVSDRAAVQVEVGVGVACSLLCCCRPTFSGYPTARPAITRAGALVSTSFLSQKAVAARLVAALCARGAEDRLPLTPANRRQTHANDTLYAPVRDQCGLAAGNQDQGRHKGDGDLLALHSLRAAAIKLAARPPKGTIKTI